jgi:hypothetical protein
MRNDTAKSKGSVTLRPDPAAPASLQVRKMTDIAPRFRTVAIILNKAG